jgi:hypothetical protein
MLCCVIAFGQVPAWLHVATCDDHSHATVDCSSDQPKSVCSHCSDHHVNDKSTLVEQDGTQVVGASGTNHGHDSAHCLICHSLASPCGVTWKLCGRVFTDFVSEPAVLATERVLSSASFSIAQPRGPPVTA